MNLTGPLRETQELRDRIRQLEAMAAGLSLAIRQHRDRSTHRGANAWNDEELYKATIGTIEDQVASLTNPPSTSGGE
jgi:hypothetical protein